MPLPLLPTVGSNTAILPRGWKERLIKIQNQNTDLKIGYCLEPHDLAASKLAAGREKDWSYVTLMLEKDMITAETLQQRIQILPVTQEQRDRLRLWVDRVRPG